MNQFFIARHFLMIFTISMSPVCFKTFHMALGVKNEENIHMMKETYGRIKDDDKIFDFLFWSEVPTSEKWDAAWEIITYYYKSKGRGHELRFRRSIETVGEVEGPIRNNRRICRNGVHRAKGHKRS